MQNCKYNSFPTATLSIFIFFQNYLHLRCLFVKQRNSNKVDRHSIVSIIPSYIYLHNKIDYKQFRIPLY